MLQVDLAKIEEVDLSTTNARSDDEDKMSQCVEKMIGLNNFTDRVGYLLAEHVKA